jgi:hypothetical protein
MTLWEEGFTVNQYNLSTIIVHIFGGLLLFEEQVIARCSSVFSTPCEVLADDGKLSLAGQVNRWISPPRGSSTRLQQKDSQTQSNSCVGLKTSSLPKKQMSLPIRGYPFFHLVLSLEPELRQLNCRPRDQVGNGAAPQLTSRDSGTPMELGVATRFGKSLGWRKPQDTKLVEEQSDIVQSFTAQY